jgi:hypothetical protein
MKKLLYLGIILMLGSCGSNEVVTDPSNESESAAESESVKSNESVGAAESESSANESESTTPTVNVTGDYVVAVEIGDLEVMTEDLGEMNWDDAMKACADFGDGWRLPTKDELNILYENKDKIGGFALNYYWSSTELDFSIAWTQNFSNGGQYDDNKFNYYYVRAVRTF